VNKDFHILKAARPIAMIGYLWRWWCICCLSEPCWQL